MNENCIYKIREKERNEGTEKSDDFFSFSSVLRHFATSCCSGVPFDLYGCCFILFYFLFDLVHFGRLYLLLLLPLYALEMLLKLLPTII